MALSVVHTQADIDAQIQKISCCTANFSYSIVTKEWNGEDVCKCSWKELAYLIGAQDTLSRYSPAGTIMMAGVASQAAFIIPNLGLISSGFVMIGDTVIYDGNGFGFLVTTAQFLDAIVSNIASGWVAAKTILGLDYLMNFSSSLSGYFSGETLTVSITSEAYKQTYVYTFVMQGGQYIQTAAMNCLTPAQAQNIIETSTEICGCSDCTQSTDAPPQPGVAIIYRNVGSQFIWITAPDFGGVGGDEYQDNRLTGLVPGGSTPDFIVFANPGGTLLTYLLDYTFDATTGTLTMPPGGYIINIK